jgi:hypothetical protein
MTYWGLFSGRVSDLWSFCWGLTLL